MSEPVRKRMVRARKAPNVLQCTRQDWMDYWESAINVKEKKWNGFKSISKKDIDAKQARRQ